MVDVKIYVEGGGDRKDLKSKCREGFRKFFEKAGFAGRMPRIIACGGRRSAYDDFCTALRMAKPDEFVILLVDSEAPVAEGIDSWTHLNSRQGDGWSKPNGADADNAHLMVQCMETWFLADKEGLKTFYGHGFRESSLPANAEIEKIPKVDLYRGLENATRDTTKGKYSKGDHSFRVLARIAPSKVREASTHAGGLMTLLSKKLLQQ